MSEGVRKESPEKEMGQERCPRSFPPQHVAVQGTEKTSRTNARRAVWSQWKGSVVQSSLNYLFVKPAGGSNNPANSIRMDGRRARSPHYGKSGHDGSKEVHDGRLHSLSGMGSRLWLRSSA